MTEVQQIFPPGHRNRFSINSRGPNNPVVSFTSGNFIFLFYHIYIYFFFFFLFTNSNRESNETRLSPLSFCSLWLALININQPSSADCNCFHRCQWISFKEIFPTLLEPLAGINSTQLHLLWVVSNSRIDCTPQRGLCWRLEYITYCYFTQLVPNQAIYLLPVSLCILTWLPRRWSTKNRGKKSSWVDLLQCPHHLCRYFFSFFFMGLVGGLQCWMISKSPGSAAVLANSTGFQFVFYPQNMELK